MSPCSRRSLGHLCGFIAQLHCLCSSMEPHNINHSLPPLPPSTCQTCRDIGNKLVFSKSVDACWGRPEYVNSLEHVQARLTLSHNQRGKLAVHLISPLGTRSTLLFPRYCKTARIYTPAAKPSYISPFLSARQTNLNFNCAWILPQVHSLLSL